jgi:hypothetical protein
MVEFAFLCAEFVMQQTSRTPPIVSIDTNRTKVVRLQRGGGAIPSEDSPPEEVQALAALMERASNAAKQMKYFGLASKQFSLLELISSAVRAGFAQVDANVQSSEASFQWASGPADLIFSVSFRDTAKVSIVAVSQADVFGLILTGYSDADSVSVETNPTIADGDLGRNAVMFSSMLLTFSGFDNLPAWTKYPEGHIPGAVGVVEMWRDGVSLSSLFDRYWISIYPRILTFWKLLSDGWYFPQLSRALSLKKAFEQKLSATKTHKRPRRPL